MLILDNSLIMRDNFAKEAKTNERNVWLKACRIIQNKNV